MLCPEPVSGDEDHSKQDAEDEDGRYRTSDLTAALCGHPVGIGAHLFRGPRRLQLLVGHGERVVPAALPATGLIGGEHTHKAGSRQAAERGLGVAAEPDQLRGDAPGLSGSGVLEVLLSMT